MKMVYNFVGGQYGGMLLDRERVEKISNGELSKDWSEARERGAIVPRKELDNQPLVDGYYSPMWDGLRYLVNGKMKYEFECTEEQKAASEVFGVIRYETPEVYEMMSN